MNLDQDQRKIVTLIVDDDQECTDVLKMTLSIVERLDIHTTTNAQEALGMIDILRPDILITDYRMPNHDGIELTAMARNINAVMSIILVTGMPLESLRLEAIKQGVDLIITKPIAIDEFNLQIRNIIRKIDAVDVLAGRSANSVFNVNLNNVNVLEIAQMFHTLQLTGVMNLDRDTEMAAVYFDKGKIIHARYGTTLGEDAFHEICQWNSGKCTFTQNEIPSEITITTGTTSLLLDSAKYLDEAPYDELPSE